MEYTLKSSKEELLARIKEQDEELKKFKESPHLESYLTISEQLSSFNSQLKLGEEKTTISDDGVKVTAKKGFIDLFAEKDDKSFDRAKWYFQNILELNKTLDNLRKLMSPEDIKDLDSRKVAKTSVAEKYIFKE